MQKRNGYSFSCREVNFFRGGMALFLEEIKEKIKQNKTIVVFAGNDINCKKMKATLEEAGIVAYFDEDIKNKKVNILEGAFETGVEYEDFNLEIISGEEFLKLTKKRKYKNQSFKNGEKILLDELNIGDYIVHQVHGIGEFAGINTLEVDKIKKDYIKIKYRNEDILYVPTDQLDNVRKYIGGGDNAPRLNKMGGKEWQKTKEKVSKSLKEVAQGLIDLYAKRNQEVGFAFSKDTVWQNEFEENFEYQETEDQLRSIEEVKKDMELAKPMDRLLCGDVGYRKNRSCYKSCF